MMSETFSGENLLAGSMLLAAVASDLKWKKVTNRSLLALLAVSLVTQVLMHGLGGVWQALSSVATTIVVCLPLYMMSIFGGGDFKLLVAISPLLHWKLILVMIVSAMVWGALLGLFRTLLLGEASQLWKNMIGIVTRQSSQPRALHMIPFTVAVFFGFLSSLTLSQIGWDFI
jgi:Flp pilus assembly protein protease CpaA